MCLVLIILAAVLLLDSMHYHPEALTFAWTKPRQNMFLLLPFEAMTHHAGSGPES